MGGTTGLVLLASVTLVLSCSREVPSSPAERIRQALYLPRDRPPAAANGVVERSWRRRDAVVEQVRFAGHQGQTIPALVSYSDLAGFRPLPVILCMPGSPNRKEDLVQPHDLLLAWAQRGFFVLSIDRPYHGERPGDPEVAIRRKGLARVLGEYVDDLGRALDYAATRPEADSGRVGMLGLSMGGMEALLLAAIDERVDCVASVSGQLSWRDIFASDAWKLIFTGLPVTERLRRDGAGATEVYDAFLSVMPELAILDAPIAAAALAPRPLLLMTGAEDPYVPPDCARRTHAEASGAYGRHSSGRLELWIEEGVGHGFSAEMERRALAWFERWLQRPEPPGA